jgi:uncharacterized membrane protein
MTHNKLGYVVLTSQYPETDLAYWKRLRPHCMTFTQAVFGLMKPAQDSIPELQVCIARTVLDNDGEKFLHHGGTKQIDDMLQAFLALVEYQQLDPQRTYLYVMNEPDISGGEALGILIWLTEFMRRARAYGVRCVIGNFSMATVARWKVDALDTVTFIDFMNELADGFHVFGFHEHTGPVPPAGAAGRVPDMYLDTDLAQQDHWPSPYDVQIGSIDGNWHVGRIFWWLERCDRLGIKHPRAAATEIDPDRMSDLEYATLTDESTINIYQEWERRTERDSDIDGNPVHLKAPWPFPGLWGVNTLRWVWERLYPQWSFARVHMEFIKWQLWVYGDAVEAVNEFAYCPGHVHWCNIAGMDAAADAEYRDCTIEYSDSIYAEPPGPDPEPIPDLPPDVEPVPLWKGVLLGVGLFVLLFVLVLGGILFLAHAKSVQALSAGGSTMDMNALLQQLFAIPAFAVVSYTAGIVWFLVEMWKRYIVVRLPEKLQAAPETVVLILIGLFMAVHGLAVEYQYDNVLKEVAQFITDLVNVLGPYVLGGVATSAVSNYAYNKLRGQQTPGFNADNPVPKE